MSQQLMPWAEDVSAEFELLYGDRGCTCFISPPCGHCAHEGHPLNLECTPEAWGAPHEVEAAYAAIEIERFIEKEAQRHLAEMADAWRGGAA